MGVEHGSTDVERGALPPPLPPTPPSPTYGGSLPLLLFVVPLFADGNQSTTCGAAASPPRQPPFASEGNPALPKGPREHRPTAKSRRTEVTPPPGAASGERLPNHKNSTLRLLDSASVLEVLVYLALEQVARVGQIIGTHPQSYRGTAIVPEQIFPKGEYPLQNGLIGGQPHVWRESRCPRQGVLITTPINLPSRVPAGPRHVHNMWLELYPI